MKIMKNENEERKVSSKTNSLHLFIKNNKYAKCNSECGSSKYHTNTRAPLANWTFFYDGGDKLRISLPDETKQNSGKLSDRRGERGGDRAISTITNKIFHHRY